MSPQPKPSTTTESGLLAHSLSVANKSNYKYLRLFTFIADYCVMFLKSYMQWLHVIQCYYIFKKNRTNLYKVPLKEKDGLGVKKPQHQPVKGI